MDVRRIDRLATRYRVPVVEFDALDVVAGEFGEPVPPEVRPADQTVLLEALADGLARRELCVPAATILDARYDAFCHSVLGWLVEC